MGIQEWYGRVENNGIYRHYPGFLRLFRYEFDILLEDVEFLEEYREKLNNLMSPARVAKLEALIPSGTTKFTRTKERDERRTMFLGLRYVEDDQFKFWKWFQMELIKHVEGRQDCRLNMLKKAPECEKENFDIFFNNTLLPNKLDCVVDLLMVNHFIEDFAKMHVPAYEEILNNWVIPVNEKYPHDFHYASCVLMRQLFYCKPEIVAEKEHSWYLDFLYICTKNVRNGTMLEYIDTEYDTKLDDYISKLNANTRLGIFGTDEFVDKDEEMTIQFRAPKTSEDEYFSIDPDNEGATLELRNYQKELVRFANGGINTIICAPTGSGKTIVAIDIIRNHLLRRNFAEDGSINERSRVVFVVPTVPLVDQQRKQIQTYLADRFIINGFSGGDHRDLDKRANEILKSHIIVITPQMLVNLLQTVNKNRRLYISDFTLFVLDECHHCGSKHPYEILMQMVRKYTKENLNGREKPQIVGLTASLGTNRETFDPTKVNEHMYSLCVRMLATQVSTVRSPLNIEELNQHVSPPIDEICSMKRAKEDPFRKNLCDVIGRIIGIIRPDVEELSENVDKLKDFKFTKPSDPGFRNVIERLFESKNSWPVSFNDRQIKTLKAIDHLRIYLHALRLNELIPAPFAFAYLDNKYHANFEGTTSDEYCQIYEESREMLKEESRRDRGMGKPILEKLKSIIENAYTENPNTRTLIFADSRCLTQYLADFLNRTSQLEQFRTDSQFAHYLTSTNQARKLGGMSSADQRNILSAFDHGNIKVLVATSVGEEGLDISACNLIIKYNTVGSERTMIQRRGRARAKNSKSYLICLDNDVEQREIENITRELLMHKCLQHIQALSPAQLEREIEERRLIMRANEKRELDLVKDNHQVRAFTDKIYDLKCTVCQRTLCTSDYIRSVLDSHYCCIERNIWNNLRISDTDSPSRDDNFIKCNPFKCIGKSEDGLNECDQVLGTVIMFADVFLPSIKHSSIFLTEKEDLKSGRARNTERIEKKKWTDMQKDYFLISPITLDNLLNMAPTLRSASVDDYEQIKLQAAYAIQKQIEKIKLKRARKNRFNLAEYNDDED